MPTNNPHEPGEPTDDNSTTPDEITLRDGESASVRVPTDGSTNIVVNVVPPQRSNGFFSSCLQGCGCLVLVLVILAVFGSFVR
jgi:hypothetical protein